MKHLIGFLFFLVVCCITVVAQERHIHQVSDRNVAGIKRMGEMPQFYTYYYLDEKGGNKAVAKIVIEVFDDSLHSLQKINTNIDATADVASVAFNNRSLIVILVDPVKNRRTYMVLDPRGEQLKKQVEDGIAKDATLPENYPSIYATSPDEFVIVYPSAAKSGGYKIKMIGNELEEKWTKNYTPTNGNRKIEKIITQGPHLLILQKETTGIVPEDKTIYSVQGIEMITGDVMFTSQLADSGTTLLYPTALNTDMGRISIVGLYFENGKVDDKKSDGLFVKVMSIGGEELTYSKIPWSSVIASNNKEVISSLNSKSIIVPCGIANMPPEKNMIIAEFITPAINSSTQAYTFKTTGILTLLIDRESRIETINTINTAPKEVIVDNKANMSVYETATKLGDAGSLSYQGNYISRNGTSYIAYTDIVKDTTKVLFQALDTFGAEKINSITVSYRTKEDKGVSETKNGVLLSPQGRLLSYSYGAPNLKLSSKKIVFQSGANSPVRRAMVAPPPDKGPGPAPKPGSEKKQD